MENGFEGFYVDFKHFILGFKHSESEIFTLLQNVLNDDHASMTIFL